MRVGYLRTLVLGLAVGAALLVLWIAMAISVGAASADNDAVICISYFNCYDPSTGMSVPNPNPLPPQTTYTTPPLVYAPGGYAPGAVAYAPSASGLAAGTVVSTYFDPRYGVVSVVVDQYGNLIDVNAATGQRIYPFYPDYGYGYGYAGYGGTYYNAYAPWGAGVWYAGYGANYCGTGLYAPACPTNVPNIAPPTTTNIVVGTRIVPVVVKSAGAAVQVPADEPQAAPAPAPVAAPAQAPAAPAQTITSMSAAQEPAAAPQVPVAAPVSVPTSGGGGGTTVQGSSFAVVAAPVADPGNDDHRG